MYKIANQYTTPFLNFSLTEMTVLKENGKKKMIANNQSVFEVTQSFFENYGIYLFGRTELRNVGNVKTGTLLRFSFIKLDFPVENIFLFNQMYGFKNSIINIGISLNSDEDCAYSFDYNLDTGECIFYRSRYFNTTNKRYFPSLEILLSELKKYLSTSELEYIDDSFLLPDRVA